MKTTLTIIIAAYCVLVIACNKKPQAVTMVHTKVAYSHPNQVDRFGTMGRQEIGTVTGNTPAGGQPMSLTDNKVVWFCQSTDASDPRNIRVTVLSNMDGFPLEAQILEFDSSAPNPPAAKFKNGLTATVTVTTHTK